MSRRPPSRDIPSDDDRPTPDHPGARLRLLLITLALAVGVVLVYAPGLGNDFSDWDDAPHVLENPHLNPVTAASFVRFWTAPLIELYAPLSFSAWALLALAAHSDVPLQRPGGGTTTLDPAVFHAGSLALHLAGALLAFALLRRVLGHLSPNGGEPGAAAAARRDLAAGVGAALWALHPVQVESVAWVTGMNNVVSGLFALGALHAYLGWAERSGGGRAAGATLLFACALLSKPSVAALPLVALLLDVFALRRPWRRAAPLVLVWCALSLGAALLTRASSGESQRVTLPLWGRPFLVGDSLAFYLGRVFLTPWRLAFDYGRLPSLVLGSWWGYATWLVPAGIALAAWRLRWRGVLLGLGIMAAAALPMLGVVPFYFHGISTVADRYLYLALLGPALAVAWAVERALSSSSPVEGRRPAAAVPAVALALCFAAVAALSALSVRQVGFWRDSEALARWNLRVNPNSARSWNNIGTVAQRQGRLDDAERAFASALQIAPGRSLLHFNLAIVLLMQGEGDEAIRNLEASLRAEPDFPQAQAALKEARRLAAEIAGQGKTGDAARAELANRWGVALARQGRTEAALACLNRAVSLDPGFADAHFNRALARERGGDAEGALAGYRDTLRLDPGRADARLNAASLLARLGRWPEAEAEARAALALRPDWPAARRALDLIQQQGGGAGPEGR